MRYEACIARLPLMARPSLPVPGDSPCNAYEIIGEGIRDIPVEDAEYIDGAKIDLLFAQNPCSCARCGSLRRGIAKIERRTSGGWEFDVPRRFAMYALDEPASSAKMKNLAQHIDELLVGIGYEMRIADTKRAHYDPEHRTLRMRPIRTRAAYLDAVWTSAFIAAEHNEIKFERLTDIYEWYFAHVRVRLMPGEYEQSNVTLGRPLDEYVWSGKRRPKKHRIHGLMKRCERGMERR